MNRLSQATMQSLHSDVPILAPDDREVTEADVRANCNAHKVEFLLDHPEMDEEIFDAITDHVVMHWQQGDIEMKFFNGKLAQRLSENVDFLIAITCPILRSISRSHADGFFSIDDVLDSDGPSGQDLN